MLTATKLEKAIILNALWWWACDGFFLAIKACLIMQRKIVGLGVLFGVEILQQLIIDQN